MVTCDSISSYSLQKLGSGAARTCVSEPRECCRGRVPSGHGSWRWWGEKRSPPGLLEGLKAKVGQTVAGVLGL